MDDDYLKFASYWRNSLADAESGKGALEDQNIKNFSIWNDVSSGRLDNTTTEYFFKDEQRDTNTVDVVLRPTVFNRLIKHGKERIAGSPYCVTPLVIIAKINREGFLFPISATIPRDLLEPLAYGSFSIGEISEYDKYKTKNANISSSMYYDESHLEKNETKEERQKRYEEYQRQWKLYLEDSVNLLNSIADSWINTQKDYELAEYAYIIKKTKFIGASKHILALYDHLLVNKTEVPLFKRFANLTESDTEPLIATKDTFNERLGHSGDQFPLALAQRDALSHFLRTNNGDILAVNGPPGTGKTTLILSIIATLWAKAALAEEINPPIVLATSTNNQAVTNIIEAFGKDFSKGTDPKMSGRWLPDINSFGAYFPSNTKKDEDPNKYHTQKFFSDVESKEYIKKALSSYLDKAKIAFPNDDCSSPKKITSLLHKKLVEQSHRLIDIKQTWDDLLKIREKSKLVSDDNIDIHLNDLNLKLSNATSEIDKLSFALNEWEKYLANESLFISLFSWLPAVRKKRYYQIKLLLAEKLKGFDIEKELINIDNISYLINELLNKEKIKQKDYKKQINNVNQIIQQEQEILTKWLNIASELGYKNDKEPNLSQIDDLADTQIRFDIFLLTTHYWEGRWLMSIDEIDDLDEEKKKTGIKTVEPRWHRRMMLTPCVVMTCYMLPSHMCISKHNGSKFEDNYAYNFADLLIIDEAGQVLPEVAAASFALAKKALVIGDTAQIPPIWNITTSIDIGNMLEEKILTGDTQEKITAEYDLIAEMGKCSASGSVMKIAQFSSRYHYDTDLARGMYLYEHRRCYDKIIGFCNELSYQGKLQPKRGYSNNNLFPFMGYLHIDGRVEKKNTGSRFNLLEAETISAWLVENRQRIEDHYVKPIEQIVSIVSKFIAQVSIVKNILNNKGINNGYNDESMTVGTVHSLQGAERAIIIFSPVYSKHEDGNFIDNDLSMLNVAVSRAKDSFLVFGDMDLFEVQPSSSPRGLLAKYLFAYEENALYFEYKQRKDLNQLNTQIYTLNGVKEHDKFLNETITSTVKHITIISPWINMEKLKQTGFIDSMTKAIAKGIQVNVITDENFNIQHINPIKREKKKENLDIAIKILNEKGITTKLVRRVHSKIVISDDNLLCIGSFNWFSASREPQYENYDTSMVYCGESLKEEVKVIFNNLNKR